MCSNTFSTHLRPLLESYSAIHAKKLKAKNQWLRTSELDEADLRLESQLGLEIAWLDAHPFPIAPLRAYIAAKKNTSITIQAEGVDAKEVVDKLVEGFENCFGEQF